MAGLVGASFSATIITVAAKGPEPDGHGVYQVATGNRNPLYYRNLVNLVREYFLDNPLYDSDGQPIVAPDWSFSGRGRAQRQLARGVKVLQRAEQVVAALPIRGKRAEISARLEERRDQGERALDYGAVERSSRRAGHPGSRARAPRRRDRAR